MSTIFMTKLLHIYNRWRALSKKRKALTILLSIFLLFYFSIHKFKQNEFTAAEAAKEAFESNMIRRLGGERCKKMKLQDIKIMTVEHIVDKIHGYSYYYVWGIVIVDGHEYSNYAFVYNTISIFGFPLNGSDIVGTDTPC